VFVGLNSGNSGATGAVAHTTGINVTYLGMGACGNANSLTNATAVGFNALCTASNQVVLGNGSVTQTVINGAAIYNSSNGGPQSLLGHVTLSATGSTFSLIAATIAQPAVYRILDSVGNTAIISCVGGVVTVTNQIGAVYTAGAASTTQLSITVASSALKVTTGSSLPSGYTTSSWVEAVPAGV
jgi:hypothetical protein